MTTSPSPVAFPVAPTKVDIPSPGFVDQNGYVHIPIVLARYIDPTAKVSLRERIVRRGAAKQDREVQMIAMTQRDYMDYWAKGEDGEWLPNVGEPPEGRMEWLRTQLRVNEEWRSWGQIRNLAGSRWVGLYW